MAAPSKVPYSPAAPAALDGARRELARAGALSPSAEYPCLQIEILRVDEVGTGAVAVVTASGEQPRARGSAVGVLGRGWVLAAKDAPSSRETGDMRRTVELETSLGLAESTRHERAVSAAAEKLGSAIARSALGYAVAADEVP